MTDCYNLRYVKVKNEEVSARPTGWDTQDVTGFGVNVDGEKVNANKWQTTCPFCANLIEFGVEEVSQDYIKCTNCGAGAENIKSVKTIDDSDPVQIDESVLDKVVAEFIDPLELEFDFEIDYARLPGSGKTS